MRVAYNRSFNTVTSATDDELSQHGVRISVVNRIGQMSRLSASHRYKCVIVEKNHVIFSMVKIKANLAMKIVLSDCTLPKGWTFICIPFQTKSTAINIKSN